MRCAVVAFARCVLVTFVRDAMRGPLRTGYICAVRCADVVRDAMRGPLRTGCICAVRCAARSLHIRGERWLQLQAQTVPCF